MCASRPHQCLCGKQVKVKRRGDDQKFIAEVLAIGIECDIALLTVKDETFWEGVNPLAFGPLPRLQVCCAGCLVKYTTVVQLCQL